MANFFAMTFPVNSCNDCPFLNTDFDDACRCNLSTKLLRKDNFTPYDCKAIHNEDEDARTNWQVRPDKANPNWCPLKENPFYVGLDFTDKEDEEEK